MFKLFRYLKNSLLPAGIAMVLLFIQAITNLTLPTYTSNIVNVGIQQSGIEEVVPTVLDQTTFGALKLLLPTEDQAILLESYTLHTQNPGLKKAFNDVDFQEGMFVLNDLSKEQLAELEERMPNAMLLAMFASGAFSQMSEGGDESDYASYLPEINLPEGVGLIEYIAMMEPDAHDEFIRALYKEIEALPETLTGQVAVYFVRFSYEANGVNMSRLSRNYISAAGIKMLGLALIVMLTSIIVSHLSSIIAADIGRDLRSGIYHNVLSFSNAEFEMFSTASLITRTTNDINNIQNSTIMLFRIVLYAPIMGIGGLLKVLQTGSSMTWIIGVAFAIIMVILLVLYRTVIPKFMGMQKLIDGLNLVSRETLTGLSVIRAFGTKEHEEKRFEKANQALFDNGIYIGRAMSILIPVITFIMSGLTVLIVWIGAKEIDGGYMQVGDIMAFIQYTMQVIMAFLMIAVVYIMLPRATVSSDRVNEVLATNSTVLDPVRPETQKEAERGRVVFENVNFHYPDGDEAVLCDINFTAEPGKTTAIIGSTGSGKTTLISLIPRLFDVSQGCITVGGVDVREQSMEALRNSIGFVPQRGQLFSGTIESNIKFADESISDERMMEAAKIAQAEEFITEKSRGYKSSIAQGGDNVSGGQKQRLSIARAIASDPDIFIFDDSFSALDFKTDAALRAALGEHTENKTIIIVAQRINTIVGADQIIVLEDGKIAGIGTHRELLENSEVYLQIAQSQLSMEELES